MATDSEPEAAALERLSALVDGELDGPATARACADWRTNETARSSWHAYQLIGDVLRSEDLVGKPASDAAFLSALRVRMQDEPIVLAPQPAIAARSPRARRWTWKASSAVAAGFVTVAGVLVMTRGSDAPAGATVAQAAAPVQVGTLPSEPAALVLSGKLIRDARLDRYLAAHKQFAGSSALGVPSGFMRNATAIESER